MSPSARRVREAPRISVNGLSEYLVAGASRRRRIVEEQKRPRDFQVTYYREAEEAICEYLLSNPRDPSILTKAVQALRPDAGRTGWQVSRRLTCIDAVKSFEAVADRLSFASLPLRRGPNSPKPLVVAGVALSVRPELLIACERDGTRFLGAVKLYFSKNEALTEEQGRYIGTLVHLHLEASYPRVGSTDYRLCHAYDVFGKKVVVAPSSFKRRRQDVAAACAEIALAWATS